MMSSVGNGNLTVDCCKALSVHCNVNWSGILVNCDFISKDSTDTWVQRGLYQSKALPASLQFKGQVTEQTTVKHSLYSPMLLRNPSDTRMTENKPLSFGWLRFRPTWLQFLNTPKWFLFFLSQYFFTQSIVLNGVYPGSISTIEKRFGYSRLVCAFISHNSIASIADYVLFTCRPYTCSWSCCAWQSSESYGCQVLLSAKKRR